MKYKNYRNSHTNEDRIYSRKNIADMSVREVFSRKDEIMSQYNSIGIPSEGELKSSPNAVWVEPYTRDDGTSVRGYWRSRPEGESNTPESDYILPKNNDWNFVDFEDFDEYLDKDIIDNMPAEVLVKYEQYKKEQENKAKNILATNRSVDTSALNQYDVTTPKTLYEGKVEENIIKSKLKDFIKEHIKPYRDYEGLDPMEKAQKFLSKHMPYWTPNQYYGLSETLADEGKPLDKYKKYNNFCKLGDIKNEQLKDILTKKVIKARQDCPVGPSVNLPLEDVDVVIPKDNSELTHMVLRSSELKEFVQKNYDRLKAGEVVNGSIEFRQPTQDDFEQIKSLNDAQEVRKLCNRFTVLHNVDLHNVKMEPNGSITMELVDYYDFSRRPEKGEKNTETMSELGNQLNKINNRAYNQQLYGKMKPYIIYKKLVYRL